MSTPVASPLVLGPLLRYVDESSAAVWVETADAGSVSVHADGRTFSAATFGVHGHHYALVECTGLPSGRALAYTVRVDGQHAWPPGGEPGKELPAPVIATLETGRPLRLAFGSCRTSVPHDAAGNRAHGIDALRAFALALAETSADGATHGATHGVTAGAAHGVTDGAAHNAAREATVRRPDLLLFLGDQVYADETSEEMREFIASRRDIDDAPGTELKDFEEYAHLYALAWRDPVNRWLLSTVPSAMIFDDHDVRDDWNTSARWRRAMEATEWWHGRIVAALASYWVYQHLGNLSTAERREDEVYRLVLAHDGAGELDLTDVLDRFAARVDQHPSTYRWSFARDIAGTRLVVVDSRAARVLEEERRSMLDESETEWLDAQMRGGVEHVLVGTSLPFLLPEGLHHLEAFSEALASGAWGRWGRRAGERLRQGADLEHWGAFQRGFKEVAAMALEVARGERGPAPRSVTFLSGDVHHSYVSRVRDLPDAAPVLQAVCSPIRNPLPRAARWVTAALSYGVAAPLGRLTARSARVADPPFRWERVRGPWFDNNLAVLEVVEDGLDLRWYRGAVTDGRHDRPGLDEVAAVRA